MYFDILWTRLGKAFCDCVNRYVVTSNIVPFDMPTWLIVCSLFLTYSSLAYVYSGSGVLFFVNENETETKRKRNENAP